MVYFNCYHIVTSCGCNSVAFNFVCCVLAQWNWW